jgi:hypothetical protein
MYLINRVIFLKRRSMYIVQGRKSLPSNMPRTTTPICYCLLGDAANCHSCAKSVISPHLRHSFIPCPNGKLYLIRPKQSAVYPVVHDCIRKWKRTMSYFSTMRDCFISTFVYQ